MMILKKKLIFPMLAICLTGSLGWKSYHKGSTSTISNHSKTSSKHINPDEDNASHKLMESQTSKVYRGASLHESGLDSTVFRKAYTGYLNLKAKGQAKSSIISIADFNLPSRLQRLWIVDVATRKLLLKTYVAHGRGSGNAEASVFSDRNNSNQSSLGFYLTGEEYRGKHGRSLRLDGLDKGFNSNARNRAIVLHGAAYVGDHMLKTQNRMGRSLGCPAVSDKQVDQVINLVKGRSVLFINGKSNNYYSAYLNEDIASRTLMAMQGEHSQEGAEDLAHADNMM